MSHFAVIVVGENVEKQLEPYAEQDMKEEYRKFEDIEDSSLEEYKNKEVDIVVFSDGSLHHKYEEQFRYNPPGVFSTEWKYPEDSTIRKGNFNELYKTFEEYMEKWHGTRQRDEETGRYGFWYNPNAKWDWYSVGGRWTGYFKAKENSVGELGRPGVFDNKPKNGWFDIIKVKDLDIDGMLESSIKEANETYDELEKILNGRPLPSWNDIREKHGENIDAAREEYRSLEVVIDLNKANFFSFGDLVEVFGKNREEYILKQKNNTMVPFAVVKDGVWYQKGEMGWFGMSSDEMTQDEWNNQFWKMIMSLDSETTLTMVDCHI